MEIFYTYKYISSSKVNIALAIIPASNQKDTTTDNSAREGHNV